MRSTPRARFAAGARSGPAGATTVVSPPELLRKGLVMPRSLLALLMSFALLVAACGNNDSAVADGVPAGSGDASDRTIAPMLRTSDSFSNWN